MISLASCFFKVGPWVALSCLALACGQDRSALTTLSVPEVSAAVDSSSGVSLVSSSLADQISDIEALPGGAGYLALLQGKGELVRLDLQGEVQEVKATGLISPTTLQSLSSDRVAYLSTSAGLLGWVDLNTGEVETLMDGLRGPWDLASGLNPETLYVSTSSGIQTFDVTTQQISPFSSDRVLGLARLGDYLYGSLNNTTLVRFDLRQPDLDRVTFEAEAFYLDLDSDGTQLLSYPLTRTSTPGVLVRELTPVPIPIPLPPENPTPPAALTITSYPRPIQDFYGSGAQGKNGGAGIRIYGDRIYLSHGSSNTPVPHKVLAFDMTTEQWIHEDGITWPCEEIRWIETFDEELYQVCYDAQDGMNSIYRKSSPSGSWQELEVGPGEHIRDLGKAGDTLYTLYASTTVPQPQIAFSFDDGANWQVVAQPELSRQLGTHLISFNDRVYSVANNPTDQNSATVQVSTVNGSIQTLTLPSGSNLIGSTEDPSQPFEMVHPDASVLGYSSELGLPGSGIQVTDVARSEGFQDRVVLIDNQGYSRTYTSLENPDPMDSTPPEFSSDDYYWRIHQTVGDRIYGLANSRQAQEFRVYESQDAVTWQLIEQVSTSGSVGGLDVDPATGDIYVMGDDAVGLIKISGHR